MADLQVRLKYKKNDEDDWTKVQDPAIRKKIQNRLAKRKSRTNDPQQTKARKGKKQAETLEEPSSEEVSQTEMIVIPTDRSIASQERIDRRLNSDTTPVQGNEDFVDASIRQFFSQPGLSEHRFLMLTQYNLLRAFVQNARLLALSSYILADDDAISPWTIDNPYPAIAPYDLAPTPTQLCFPHHPYIDLLTPKGIRNNVLHSRMSDEVEEEFCQSIHHGGFVVWGEQSWSAMAWEVTQPFADQWGWLFDDELIRTTNFWRGERGEGPIIIPDPGSGGTVLGEVF